MLTKALSRDELQRLVHCLKHVSAFEDAGRLRTWLALAVDGLHQGSAWRAQLDLSNSPEENAREIVIRGREVGRGLNNVLRQVLEAAIQEPIGDEYIAAMKVILSQRIIEPLGEPVERLESSIADQLLNLYERKDAFERQGRDMSHITEEIRALKRELRSGPQLVEGDILADRYVLQGRLGKGGFATVWDASDRKARMRVAVKVLHGHHAGDQTRIDRFLRGARIMARLQHSGIVRVFEPSGEDEGHIFYVMEYIEGGDLKSAFKTGNIRPSKLWSIVREVAESLGYCHSQGVIHRDLKPSNILLTLGNQPKITDFDLVWAPDTTGGTDGVLGTVPYVAPECTYKPQEVDPRADVFSLSMTTIVGLRGGHEPSISEVFRPSLINDLAVPSVVQRFLARGIAEDKAARPYDAVDWLQGLRQAIEQSLGSDADVSAKEKNILEGEERNLSLPERRSWWSGIRDFAETWAVRASRTPGAVSKVDMPTRHQWLIREGGDIYGRWREVDLSGTRVRFRWIRAGIFWMGADESDNEAFDDEKPRHQVKLTRGFWLAATPCTQALWQALTGRTLQSETQALQHPVVNVSWDDVCSKLQQFNQIHSGVELRLPSEAEWEYACRADSPESRSSNLDDIAWYRVNSEGQTHSVALKRPNAWGLYDMLGNVWEWCLDEKRQYSLCNESPVQDPLGTMGGGAKIRRGGCWLNPQSDVRVSARSYHFSSLRHSFCGFRMILVDTTSRVNLDQLT